MLVGSAGRSSNGRTEAFEAFNLGPIPSLPALAGSEHPILEDGYLGSNQKSGSQLAIYRTKLLHF